MNTVIVYYSLEGNTDYAAKRIADITGADIIRLYPKKTYPDKGFRKFLFGGKSAVMAETPELEAYSFNSDKYERVIFGFPIWASNIAPPIRTFIKENNLIGKHISAFACQSGSGAEKAFEKLKACLNTDKLDYTLILIDPKLKPNEENNRKINEFCEALLHS
ncbi:MAG: flavodoxin [Clostridiales bacterium]|nr:flavodoxin [Clostridiales bacterium]